MIRAEFYVDEFEIDKIEPMETRTYQGPWIAEFDTYLPHPGEGQVAIFKLRKFSDILFPSKER